MKSEWQVSSNRIAGKMQYIVFRFKDIDAVNHSGNREYFGGYTEDYESRVHVAQQLNDLEEQKKGLER
jgi:hypothetical protein